MSTIASTNGKHLPNGVLLALDEEAARDASSNDQTNTKQSMENKAAVVGSIVDVIRTPITRIRLFVTMTIYFLGCLAYYGLSLNVVNLKSNLYMNVALNSVAEMPAFAITAMLLEEAVDDRDSVAQRVVLLDGEFDEERWGMEGGENGVWHFGDILDCRKL